jgi:hypothetical protein
MDAGVAQSIMVFIEVVDIVRSVFGVLARNLPVQNGSRSHLIHNAVSPLCNDTTASYYMAGHDTANYSTCGRS